MSHTTLFWIYDAHGRFYQCYFGEHFEHKIQVSNIFAHYDDLKSDIWTVRLFFYGDYSPRLKDDIRAKTPEEAQKLAVKRVKEYVANNLNYWQYMLDTINSYKYISVKTENEE